LFSACLHPAASTIKPISPASPSLPGEESLALGPTTEFSERALGSGIGNNADMKKSAKKSLFPNYVVYISCLEIAIYIEDVGSFEIRLAS